MILGGAEPWMPWAMLKVKSGPSVSLQLVPVTGNYREQLRLPVDIRLHLLTQYAFKDQGVMKVLRLCQTAS